MYFKIDEWYLLKFETVIGTFKILDKIVNHKRYRLLFLKQFGTFWSCFKVTPEKHIDIQTIERYYPCYVLLYNNI